jgi:GMP synthase-like glutamine amidotransferase
MSRPAVILQHGDWGPPGLLGEWAVEQGIELEVHRVDRDCEHLPALDDRPFLGILGSDRSPLDRDVREVVAELDYVERAVEREVPVLGLCYGGQVLATVLGGTVERAPQPELGWHEVDSVAPEVVASGPWLQWHYDRFTLPPGATELARSPRAVQAFTRGPHLGVQFHPESTIEVVKEWARLDTARLATLGIEDGEALVERGRAHAARARKDAFRLFDAFWRQLQSHTRRAA